MEKIVETRAVHTVTIRHVKNLKDNASLVVMMDFMVKNVRGNVYTFIRCIDNDTVTLAFLNSD